MMENTPYTIPRESRRWRAVMLAGGLHVVLLGALWLGARGPGNAHVPFKAEPAPRAEGMSPAREMAKPEVQPKEVRAVKQDASPEPQQANKLLEQKRRVENARVAELKRKENERRMEQQKVLAKQRAVEKREALARESREKEQAQQRQLAQQKLTREALAKKNAAEAARKLAAESSEREKLRKEEMRRIAGGLAAGGRS